MNRIFIGWDSRFTAPAKVLEHSLRKHSSIPLDIRFLEYEHLRRCHGFNRVHDPLASTEFTYSRFLVPWLCDYDGVALFMDNDMLAFDDVAELFHSNPADGWALRVVKHDHQVVDGSKKMYGAVQTSYPRKNWSSLMMMNCKNLRLWSRRVVETESGKYLHRFEGIPDDQILELDPRWNSLDKKADDTAILHWTSGGPWFKEYQNCDSADLWAKALQEQLDSTLA